MMEILRNKKLTTRFQIMVEIANSGPNVQQRDIARKLNITPQAVSDYIAQLTGAYMLVSEGRSRFKITNEGVNWIIKTLKELSSYKAFIEKAITSISVCTAIADCGLTEGQKVGLKMKDGLLYATEQANVGATGIAVSNANKDEDVGITGIEGIVTLQIGKVTILKVPGIQGGGSRNVNLDQIKGEIRGRSIICAMGIEALIALRKVGAKFHIYGAKEAAIEAAQSGLQPLVVCVEDEAPSFVSRLEEEKIGYELIDVRKG
jgi:putative transcriptional regulator